jgi:hypothetical protein
MPQMIQHLLKKINIKVLVDMMEYAHSPTIVPMAHDIFWREFLGARERAIHKIQTPEQALRQAENVIQISN